MASDAALHFLNSLLGKTLHISILDQRRFTGCFRCTDNDSNIVLSNTFEYRKPSAKEEARLIEEAKLAGKSVKADMTSRFLGLVTIGRTQIVKIELEERRADISSTQTLPMRVRT